MISVVLLTRTSFPVLFQEWMLPSKKENLENTDFSGLGKDSAFEDPYNISTLTCIFSTFDIFWLWLPDRSATQKSGLTSVPAKAEGSISGRASWLSFRVRSFSGTIPCNWPNQSLSRDGLSNRFQPFCWPHLAINNQRKERRFSLLDRALTYL